MYSSSIIVQSRVEIILNRVSLCLYYTESTGFIITQRNKNSILAIGKFE